MRTVDYCFGCGKFTDLNRRTFLCEPCEDAWPHELTPDDDGWPWTRAEVERSEAA